MSSIEEIKKFAEKTLGEVPKVIDLLSNIDEKTAIEQFDENVNLYLGRSVLPKKISSLIAMSVALANGPKESAIIHFNLSRKFGADNIEILDAIKATKMAIMSSLLDSLDIITNNQLLAKKIQGSEESYELIDELKKNVGTIPERIIKLAKLSPELAREHLRERSELLINSSRLDKKYMFAIALAVSISLRDKECVKTYLDMFVKYGGNLDEIIDILSIARFISGNRAFVNSIDILSKLANIQGTQ
ncbi:carboxymuconolactone decarboxylase family protein [Caldisphaera sp.]|uniref:carboxymuconolactone decarboxylase family protein n=2 Tax=Caldisphaera sp. TaxID=2060322 RepID=UPI003D0AD3E7